MSGTPTIINLILIDHRTMKKCISALRDQGLDNRSKLRRAKEFLETLKAHTENEEEILYKKIIADRELHKKILESFEEHSISSTKSDELLPKLKRALSLPENLEAKLKVLSDVVEHHLREEENEVLPHLDRIFSKEELIQMGSEYKQARGFSEKEISEAPQLLDEMMAWTNSVLDLSRQFKEKTQRYIQSWR